ncbi:hypothetical protein PFISCL1PPCAC_18544, partial [Pristionchus fissidentatus]
FRLLCSGPSLSIVLSIEFQMQGSLLALVGLLAVAVAQQCGQTPIKPNLLVGAKLPQTANVQTGNAVIGGNQVNAYSWPWTVALCSYDWFNNCNFQAAGTIIGNQWILTTASALGTTKAKDWRVQAGVYDESNKNEPTEQFVAVSAVYIHSQYDGSHNDIALIQLTSPLRFDQFTQPVCLPSNDYNAIQAGQYQWFTGWGYTTNYQFGNPTKQMQQAQLYIDPLSVCSNYYKDSIWDSQICVGTPQKTTCNYDVGGPLLQQANTNSAWYQYGISSYRAKNCDAASVFTRVSSYCSWITSYTGIKCV